MRLDKYLCDVGLGTRSEVKKLIKSNKVYVNNLLVKDPGFNVNENEDQVKCNNQLYHYEKDVYFVFYKPAGCVSAREDALHKTVTDYFPLGYRDKINPVGRLDLDTEGLLILTSDGELLHRLISPKHEVPKTYYAVLDRKVPDSAIVDFKRGIDIGDEKKTLPAELEILEEDTSAAYHAILTIKEGRFHQVKRMFSAIGCEVTYLKRIQEGNLTLMDLKPGEYVKLSKEELINKIFTRNI